MDDDALYEVPLSEFVAARKALEKRLRAGGDRDRAAEVAKLEKPTLVAWTLNQLVRRDRHLVEAVLGAIDRQRDLQLGALTGGLDAAALAKAKDDERKALRALSDRARAIWKEAGNAASKTNLDKLTRSLRDIALDAAQRERLEAGRLVDEAATVGLEAVASQIDPALLLAALEAAKTKKPPKPRVDSFLARSARGDRARPAKVETASKKDEIARAQAQAAALRAELTEREREASTAAERVTALERDLDAARLEMRAARRRLRELRERLETAERRLRLLTT